MSCRIFSFNKSLQNIFRTQEASSLYRPQLHQSVVQTRSLETYSGSRHALHRAICLVTGASRGIGRAIAVAFAREGAGCLLIGRDEAALKETYDLCAAACGAIGRQHFVIPGDITNHSFWSDFDKHPCWEPENGKLDVLVNAAGISHSSLLIRTSQAKVDDILNINLSAAIQASRFAAKKMLKNMPGACQSEARRGHILNISSVLATHGGAGSVAYAASKAGVLGLTRSLVAEMGTKGIRVNAICPGYVETDMTKAMPYTARDVAFAKIPAGRFGTVDEIADAAVFLCGNNYANNTVLNIDGGLSAV